MQLFHTQQCSIQNRNVHISVLNGELGDMEQVHSGICETGLFHHIYFKLQETSEEFPDEAARKFFSSHTGTDNDSANGHWAKQSSK